MKAQMKSGKIVSGKFAETAVRIGIAKEVEEPNKPNAQVEVPEAKKPAVHAKKKVSENGLKNLKPKQKKAK